ncbi:TRAP transporter small permease subunit [Roseococcus sp. DSY-14]|uniref:TRAP transporter small permease subunit n=1 Tax=Roseococcus sp. DSY-14 TaxID=3369650 RepID=UPI00387B496B
MIGAVSLARRSLAGLAALMGHLAGWGFIACAGLITFDVVARNTVGFSSQSTTELSGYALAFGIAWGLAHALARRAHVRIDLLVMKLPAPVRPWLHLLAMAFLLGFAATLTWAAWMLVDESLLFGARDMSLLGTPLWLPQGLWLAGIAVMAALALLLLLEGLLLTLAGRGADAEALLVARTDMDEAKETLEILAEVERRA